MKSRRVFFALWPDDAVRAAMVERRALLGDEGWRRVPDHNLHATLVFLGDQPAERIEAIEQAAGTVRAAGFELVLDRFGWFPGARVAWLGGPAPDGGRVLIDALQTAMDAIGADYDRRPWRPHVTVYRRVSGRPRLPEMAPLNWPVSGFSLIESVPGRPYQVLRNWPLQ